MKKLIYRRWLRGLMVRNFYMREVGILEDKWYWASKVAGRWGCLSSEEYRAIEEDVASEHVRNGTSIHNRNPYGSFWN